MPGKPQKFLLKPKAHQLFQLFSLIKPLDFKRLIAWAIIALQVMLPVNLAFAPALAAKHMQPGRVATVPYTLGPGETPTILAERYHLSIEELEELNQFRTFAKSFASLGTGDDIDVPRPKSAFFKPVAGTTTSSALDNNMAALARSGGTMLSAQDSADTAMSMARSHMASAVGQSAKHWLDQFGTARLEFNFNNKFQLDNSALDLLIPLYENEDALIYTQGGMRNKGQRNTGNIGAGVRAFHGEWMYGINTFYDNDFTGNNRRGGIGGEAWTHHLKLSANSYFRLSSWRQSRDFTDYDERPANGFDLRAEAYLPSYPHLGGKLIYENYRGDEVALFSKNDRQKNPSALTAGLSYTPIPLLTFGGEHRIGAGGRNDSSINVQVQYRLGESWRTQVDPFRVAAGRTLAGSRYDLVERNNHIVLEYKKRDIIRLHMPQQVNGNGGQALTITAQVTATHALDRIEWDAGALIAAGGTVKAATSDSLLVTLPAYRAGDDNNLYTLGAIAFDKKGNVSNRTHTTLTVSGHGISVSATSTMATPDTLAADGFSTSLLTIYLKDDSDKPLTGLADALTLTPTFTARHIGPAAAGRMASTKAPSIGGITETDIGVYSAVLVAGTDAGQAVITPSIHGQQLTPISINLQGLSAEAEEFEFSVSSDSLTVGSGNVTLTLTAMDVEGKFLSGLAPRVQFIASSPDRIAITAVEEVEGKYTALLSGAAPGTIQVSPAIDGVTLDGLSKTITLLPRDIDATLSTFDISKTALVADSMETATLLFMPVDSNGQTFEGLGGRLAFNVLTEGGAGLPAGNVTLSAISENNGAYTATVSAAQPGNISITPVIDGNAISAMAKSMELVEAVKGPYEFTFTLSRDRLAAGNRDSVALRIEGKDSRGNPFPGTMGIKALPTLSISLSNIQQADGVYTADLLAGNEGEFVITPVIDDEVQHDLAKKLTAFIISH